MKTDFFGRVQRLHTMSDVNRKLAERTGKPLSATVHTQVDGGVAQSSRAPDSPEVPGANPAAALVWKPPVKATQTTQDGQYEIRGARVKEVVTYYAWSLRARVPKLLGYSTDPQLARNYAQTHAEVT